ncbi:MAG: helix-turn-helix domain-containing protein [Nitrosomonas sp.]|nr:helix-turn-helix domain-containing protein [Nitrosomonas sp.]MBP7113760.1 helix-turn-helix domain-containing protein [Nitrosomonas sp.]
MTNSPASSVVTDNVKLKLTHYRQGRSIRHIAKTLGVSRNTVHHYLEL